MGCTTIIQTADCFGNRWKMCRGVYWSLNGAREGRHANVIMSRTGGNCPSSGREKRFYLNKPDTFDEFTVKCFYAGDSIARIEVWKTSELEPENPELGAGKAEITQTGIGPGLLFEVGSSIECLLRVMNTGETDKIYGAIGLGYHDNDGNIFFTGRYAIDNIELPKGETFTWNLNLEVLHKDYTAREMTPRGPAVYFMAGHEENDKIVWDRSEYIPVELLLKSGYVDPTDPDEIPDDWKEPVYDPSKPWDIPWDIPEIPSFWNWFMSKPSDMMLFIYIGFVSIIAYMLLKSQ